MKTRIQLCIYAVLILNAGATIGQVKFQKKYTIANFLTFNSIISTYDGGYFTSGGVYQAGISKVLLSKFTSTGDTVWTKSFADTSSIINGLLTAKAAIQTADSGFLVASELYSAGRRIYIIRTNKSGDTLWTRRAENAGNMGSVIQAADGNFMVYGSLISSIDSTRQLMLMKMDDNGNVLWIKNYINSLPSINQFAYSIAETNDGGFVLTGLTGYVGCSSCSNLIIKTDSTGDFQWGKIFSETPISYMGDPVSVCIAVDGSIIVAGNTNGFGANKYTMFLMKLNLAGDTIWTKRFEAAMDAWCSKIRRTANGGFIMTGRVITAVNTNSKLFIMKFDSAGQYIYTRLYRMNPPPVHESTSSGFDVFQTSDGGYIACGSSFNSGFLVKTDPLANTTACIIEVFAPVIKYAPYSTLNWTANIVSGMQWQAVPITIQNESFTIVSCSPTGLDETEKKSYFRINPNPVSDKLNIEFEQWQPSARIEIFNTSGSIIFSEHSEQVREMEISLSNYPSGLYFLRVCTAEECHTKKIAVE